MDIKMQIFYLATLRLKHFSTFFSIFKKLITNDDIYDVIFLLISEFPRLLNIQDLWHDINVYNTPRINTS